MARIRSIHPDACDSEKLAELSDAAERLFWRLQTHCDDDGRCDDNVRLISAKCVPLLDWNQATVDGLLDELQRVGLLQRYEVAGKGYVQVSQWGRFQKPRKPQRGKRPAPVSSVDNQPVRTGSTSTSEPVAHPSRTGSDPEVASVAQGEEWRGEEWRPPIGGGGSRGEGVDCPQDDLVPGPNPDFVRLQSRIADVSSRLATTGEPS